VRNGQTKNGKPFAVLSIEDYNSSVELFLMGEKYMNHAQYLRPGEFLFISGRVELNWRKKNEIRENPHINPSPEDWELQPAGISLLSELREKRSKGIRVVVNARDVDQNFIDLISKLAKEHEGQTQLRIQLIEKSENISVELLSRKIKVDPNSTLIRTLKKVAKNAQLITN
ncbi:MAG: DNA polymerase-3 subunit alpha, partial [Roseivirga sp.]